MLAKFFSSEETNNYKLIFPLAIPGFIAGIGLWFIPEQRAFITRWHPWLMSLSFLFPIVLGFLWTGIPRFCAARFPSPIWKIFYILGIVLAFIAFLLDSLQVFLGIYFVLFLGLLLWYLELQRTKKASPFVVLAFLLFAFLSGTLGIGLRFASFFLDLPAAAIAGGRALFPDAFFLLLITAVGSRFFGVMGGKTPPAPGSFGIWSWSASRKPLFWYALGALSFLLLAIPPFLAPVWVRVVHFLLFLLLAREIWFLFRPGRARGLSAFFLTASLSLALVSPLARAFLPIREAGGAHVLYIPLLFVLVLIVAARVILAHGGYNLEKEQNSPLFFGAYSLAFLSLPVRLAADYYNNAPALLHASLGLLFFAFLFWLTEIARSLFLEKSKGES